MPYLLDSDTFIRAKNDHYGFDICPGFWDWLKQSHATGQVFSVAKVGDELMAGNDELATWAKAQGHGFFLPVSAASAPALSTVSTWVQSQGFPPAAVANYFSKADYFIVAQALELGYTVVTHEVFAPTAKTKIKIPNVCIGVGVNCMNIFNLLKAEKACFVLK